MSPFDKFFEKLEEERDDVVKKFMRDNYSILLTISSVDLDFTKKYRFWTILLLIYNYSILINQDWMLFYSLFLLKDDFDAASGVGNYAFLILLAILFGIDFTYYRNSVLRSLKFAATGIYEYPDKVKESDELLEFRSYLKFQNKMLMILAVYVCWIGVLAVLGPFIDDLLGLGYEETYDENGVNRKLPVPLFFPFDSTTWLGYITAMAMTTLSGCATCAVIGAVSLVFNTICQFILLELKKVSCSMRAIQQRARKKYCKKFNLAKGSFDRKEVHGNPEYQECISECIKENILHHQKIKMLVEEFQSLSKMLIFACFCIVTMALGLSMIKLNQDVTRPGSSVAFASVALGELFNILNLCINGQLMINLSQELHWTVYFTPWYTFNIKNRKLISQFALCTRSPITLEAWIVQVDMEMFSSMMNTAYSFFNFLKLSDNIQLD